MVWHGPAGIGSFLLMLGRCAKRVILRAEAPTNDDEEDDAEEDDDLEGSDLDVALPAFMGESRAQLMRSQDMARGQLLAAAAVSPVLCEHDRGDYALQSSCIAATQHPLQVHAI